jgi:hypothetical protein
MMGATQLLVSKDTKYAASNGTASAATTPFHLDEGAIGIYKEDGNGTLTLLQAGDGITDAFTIYFAQGLPGNQTPRISKGIGGTFARRLNFQEGFGGNTQTWAVGYDGNTGSIETFTDEYYTLHITENAGTPAKALRETFDYTTPINGSGSSLQYEIATNFARKINGDAGSTRKTGSELVHGRVRSNGSIGTLGEGITLTKDSNVVTATGDVTAGGLTNPITGVGDYFAIGEDVFTVTFISNNGQEFHLDRTYPGDNTTIAANTSGTGVVTSVSDFGIWLETIDEGVSVDVAASGGHSYYRGGFSSTPVRQVTAYQSPMNTGEKIYDLENYTLGYLGKTNYHDTFANNPDRTADPNQLYNTYTIEYVNEVKSHYHTGYDGVQLLLIIAVPKGSYQGRSTFETRLNGWFQTTPRSLSV